MSLAAACDVSILSKFLLQAYVRSERIDNNGDLTALDLPSVATGNPELALTAPSEDPSTWVEGAWASTTGTTVRGETWYVAQVVVGAGTSLPLVAPRTRVWVRITTASEVAVVPAGTIGVADY